MINCSPLLIEALSHRLPSLVKFGLDGGDVLLIMNLR